MSLLTRVPAAALVLLAASACRKDAAEEKTKAEVSVRTVVVGKQSFTETVGALGVVTVRSGRAASLGAPAPTRVTAVLVTTGQTVAAGQVLVELDQTPFQAALQSATAALDAAQRAHDRAERLANEGVSPRKDVEAAAAELGKARAEAMNARRNEQLATIRAPISGVVTQVNVAIGTPVDANQQLVQIADPGALDILLNLTPTEAGRVRRGAKVSLSAGQDAAGEPLGVASVVDVAGTVDSMTRSVAVRVQAPTTRRPLRIGETVYGDIAIVVKPNAIVVPVEALVPGGEGFKVFVVDSAGMAHEREVKIGARTSKFAEVLEGLAAGERVVTYGAYGLEDSVKVVPMKQP
jgi:membrane fusion protein (multidrug efflux system)